MRINIQANGFVLTPALKDYTEQRLKTALSWADVHTSKFRVSLSDINGPRGGCDKRCVIEIQITGGKAVVIEDTETDMYHAIDRAVERADRAVVRQIERLREFSHVRVFAGSAPVAVDDNAGDS